jgi:DsbC/DsbD-like thiol-disulfide interchange protein
MRVFCNAISLLNLARLGFFLCLTGFAPAAHAEISDWVTSEGGRMRIVTTPSGKDGALQAALQIEPNAGWMTYWREPGEAGIPPQVTTPDAGRANIGPLVFPVPKLLINGDLRDIGYDQPVTLPFTLDLENHSDNAGLKLSAFIGVCRNICIPFQAEFTLSGDASGKDTVQEQAIITAALHQQPQPPAEDFKIVSHSISADRALLSLELLLPENATEMPDVFVTGPEGYAFSYPKNIVRDGRKLSFQMKTKGLPKHYDITGKTWQILVKTKDRAIETTLGF